MIKDIEGLIQLLERLKGSHIYFQLARYRDDAVSIEVFVPGQRWEIDVLTDGEVCVEVFKSAGEIYGSEKLEELISEFASDRSG